MSVFLGCWNNQNDVERSFADPTVMDFEIIVADYESWLYEGEAYVLVKNKEGKLFEVQAGHCSCYDLSGAWYPMEVTVEYLELRLRSGHFISPEVRAVVRIFVEGLS
jgi:hypothetical protein